MSKVFDSHVCPICGWNYYDYGVEHMACPNCSLKKTST